MDVLNQTEGKDWVLYNGDCVEVLQGIPENSIHYSVFSPPFGHSLFVYSASDRDMGNGREYRQFLKQYSFFSKAMHRVMMPGRSVSIHCMDIPLMKERDGCIGMRDMPGDLTRIMNKAGFVKHSEIAIRKNPAAVVQRTKAIGLLYKQLRKDSAISRQIIPDKFITFRKLGVNPVPVTKDAELFPCDKWQDYAEYQQPYAHEWDDTYWDDINPGDTLNVKAAREEKDERHLCPTQLTVIRRGIELWSNPGEVVLSPFAGIGSEGHEALRVGRKYVGIELKPKYWEVAAQNLRSVSEKQQMSLLDLIGVA